MTREEAPTLREAPIDRNAVGAYVGKCPKCGSIRVAMVDDPAAPPSLRRDMAKECGKIVRDGLLLERSTVGEVRGNPAFLRDCAGNPCPINKRRKRKRAEASR